MDIESIYSQIEAEIQRVNTPLAWEEFRTKYLGRRGVIAQLTSSISGLPPQERSGFGQQVNALKTKIVSLLEEKHRALSEESEMPEPASCDMAMPGIAQELGVLHPVTQVVDAICGIFERMGFSVVEGPQLETEYNNFTGLNIPLEHPSRDVFDTFYVKSQKLLLRSHTSPVQVRVMKSRKPPLAVVVPGRVYRPDAVDASHSFMFHQIEGFMVDTDIRFSDLKGVLELFARAVFGPGIKMRFRPHFFPFTEPSAEVDISCIICQGKGCSVCGRKGWLEILGSGMIHPNVFRHVGYDPKKYSGFAFGMGVERIAMLKYGINDIRLFFENDLRFLKQF
jgi:phenylalanyl-tRNA synthetase alpha chain